MFIAWGLGMRGGDVYSGDGLRMETEPVEMGVGMATDTMGMQ